MKVNNNVNGCDVTPLQEPAHRSRVSAESLAESASRFAQRPPLQSVFLHGQVEGVPQAEGGETRPGPHQAPAPLPAVAQSRLAAKNCVAAAALSDFCGHCDAS